MMHLHGPPQSQFVISIFEADVRKSFSSIKPPESCGDKPGCVLKTCIDQPAGVFMDIFNGLRSQPAARCPTPAAGSRWSWREAKIMELWYLGREAAASERR